MRINHTLKTTAPPENIWALWTDVKSWPRWDPSLAEASLGGEFDLNVKGTLRPKKGGRSMFEITDLIPGQSYTLSTQMPLCTLRIERSLAQEEPGTTTFTQQVTLLGPLAFLFKRLMQIDYEASGPEAMENLRRLAEQGG